MAEVSHEFAECWNAAGIHLQEQGQGALQWLRAQLAPPFLEHFSFRMGNQLFFIRVEDIDERVLGPSSIEALFEVATGCNGHACVMPMAKRGGEWRCAAPGWGLIDAHTEKILNPVALVTDEQIEMTDWELQDFSVQIVRNDLEKNGKRLMSWQSNPGVNPSIWFVGDDGPEWVLVRAARWPERDIPIPSDIDQMAAEFASTGKTGHFAVVCAANTNDSFDLQANSSGNYLPLVRGEGIEVKYAGLKLLVSDGPVNYNPPDDLSGELMVEFVNWFNRSLANGNVLPKMFSGVNRDGRQFLIDLSRVDLDIKKHLGFMRYVLFFEKSIAYAYKMRTVAEVCEEPLIHQEQHVFHSGCLGSYHFAVLISKSPDGWHEGSKLVSQLHSEEPETFFDELLPFYHTATDDDELFNNTWQSIRGQVVWRNRA